MAKGQYKDTLGDNTSPGVLQEKLIVKESMAIGTDNLSAGSNTEEVPNTEALTVIIEGSLVENEPQVISRNVYEILKSRGIKVELC